MDDQVHKAFDHLAQTIRKTDNPQDLVWLLQRTGEQYQEVKDKVIKVIAEGVRDRERFGQGVSWLLEKPADALTLALKLLEPLPDYLVDVLTPPKQPQPPGTSRFLWTGQKGSKPLEKPTARPRQTIPIVAAVFFREMGIDAGDPASWVLSPPRLGGDGKNHTFLAFGDQECEVIWHPDWWLFDRPKKRGA